MNICLCLGSPGATTCHSDPLLYFPFSTHTNDIQCHKVAGTVHGNAYIDDDIDSNNDGSLCLDGDGDYLDVMYHTTW